MSRVAAGLLTFSCIVLVHWTRCTHAADAVLPQGDAPPAIVIGHFPDRVHEFVWRNWNAVEPARLAKILGASVKQVTDIAVSMGLPAQAVVPREQLKRGYITLIRRNWHLLPYEQLLELVEMKPEQLAFALREEDFLYIKLGSLKPKCELLCYQPPDEAAKQRAAEIRSVVEEYFGDELTQPGEPRFEFVRQLSSPLPSPTQPPSGTDRPVSLRFVYSYLAVYGDALINPELDPYPDGFLQRLSAVGVNGVWMHTVLRDIAPGGPAFPEFGVDHEKRLANLRRLVQRAKQYGIGVYLYMNEPRAMPSAFFDHRPEMAGVCNKEFTALCTSHPAVRRWMGDALAHVFREVPDLAGIYAITACENLTNCASQYNWKSCERCKNRTDTDIIAEVAAVLEEGVHRSRPTAKVILSDWGWRQHGDSREIIAQLPKSTWLMSVSEWSLPIERGGTKSAINEYAISAVGPGPRALSHWKTAKQAGLKTAAEIQFNNTCELASLPYLPVLDLIGEHCHNLASEKLNGMLIGWTMGGHPSPNFELAQRMNREPTPDAEIVLDELALERFGTEGAPHARKAWKLMSDAFREYPFNVWVVYNSPVQLGPANPLYPEKTHYKATMWGIPYDDLDGWRSEYPPQVFAAQFQKVADGWRPGVAELQIAVENTSPERRQEVQADLRYARAAAIIFQSVANQARFVMARDQLAEASDALSPQEQQRARDEIKQILLSEIDLAHQLYVLTREDSRIGFEPSCQYFYLPLDLVEKVINCRWLLAKYES